MWGRVGFVGPRQPGFDGREYIDALRFFAVILAKAGIQGFSCEKV
ncbi:hypothetical protein GLE_3899 [Lysobacter enzymogenes]|uniref:Uncharacterized protein n=1 Tax=Lysobacter enzymogenes TaxID=69 RepID=A0A0S2DKZ3_LYSEN|nr:hypothetical protein GLE_3899 [Lysobacter enzymogenes]